MHNRATLFYIETFSSLGHGPLQIHLKISIKYRVNNCSYLYIKAHQTPNMVKYIFTIIVCSELFREYLEEAIFTPSDEMGHVGRVWNHVPMATSVQVLTLLKNTRNHKRWKSIGSYNLGKTFHTVIGFFLV